MWSIESSSPPQKVHLEASMICRAQRSSPYWRTPCQYFHWKIFTGTGNCQTKFHLADSDVVDIYTYLGPAEPVGEDFQIQPSRVEGARGWTRILKISDFNSTFHSLESVRRPLSICSHPPLRRTKVGFLESSNIQASSKVRVLEPSPIRRTQPGRIEEAAANRFRQHWEAFGEVLEEQSIEPYFWARPP